MCVLTSLAGLWNTAPTNHTALNQHTHLRALWRARRGAGDVCAQLRGLLRDDLHPGGGGQAPGQPHARAGRAPVPHRLWCARTRAHAAGPRLALGHRLQLSSSDRGAALGVGNGRLGCLGHCFEKAWGANARMPALSHAHAGIARARYTHTHTRARARARARIRTCTRTLRLS